MERRRLHVSSQAVCPTIIHPAFLAVYTFTKPSSTFVQCGMAIPTDLHIAS
ncbi:hypothetical protein FOQG_17642 [Fusarium oxysporum f. sp. raphani 54005]|uniref:Uncharacterized protein n=1 Tax=Fusarium oxysporum f. sp. raphani 54005 TaxID=1089458 RepID=X0B6B9_FUSOX|nr:hypothetical protein FOQG_17642 [Fusarium oxysporum f. sp. raphani 54005]